MCAKFDIKRFNGQSIKGGSFGNVANAMDLLTYFMAHSETKRIEVDVERTDDERSANADSFLGYVMFTDDREFWESETPATDPHVVIYHNAIGPVVRYFDSENSARECIKKTSRIDTEAVFDMFPISANILGEKKE